MKNILLIFSCFLFTSIYSQQEVKESFRPVFSGGMVASQVDGDTYSGYHKIGYFFGMGINRLVTKKLELEFSITLLQKGARKNYALDSASRNNPNNEFYLLRLNYLEVPIGIKYNHKKFKIETGGAFAYLIKNPPYEQSQNGYYNIYGFKNFDYSLYLGLGYKLKPNLLINLRYENSLIAVRNYYPSTKGIYHGQFPYNLFNVGLYNNLLVLSLSYKLPVLPSTSTGGQ
jgi:hypothetical protein